MKSEHYILETMKSLAPGLFRVSMKSEHHIWGIMKSILNCWDSMTGIFHILGQHGQYTECLGHHYRFIEHLGTAWPVY